MCSYHRGAYKDSSQALGQCLERLISWNPAEMIQSILNSESFAMPQTTAHSLLLINIRGRNYVRSTLNWGPTVHLNAGWKTYGEYHHRKVVRKHAGVLTFTFRLVV